ncbi:ATP-binding protein [Chryseobacterium sp.]|uniref:ATP-binding protein n=1 Tax=Chryseobacterium sp. TaxID=1871047 RepID=UPI000ECC8090|nr:ATP-binding protein [Chryseobacterium sp.]HCM33396.1 ATP-binding protein [Chryseobacterium sp.]
MKVDLQKDSIFKVGKVISVEGRTVKIEVDKTKNSSHLLYNGELLRNISVNGYIKITKGFTKIIGKVEGEFILEDKQISGKDYKSEKFKIKRILIISLLGFFSKKGFERGIKELPLINNECYLLEKEEFEDVHDFVKKGDAPLTLGTLTHENEQKISVGINDLFASHIGIFGNTGSGKSYTLAKIYRELFLKFIQNQNFIKNTQFTFIDFNGEYIGNDEVGYDIIIEQNKKQLYNLSTRDLTVYEKYPIGKEGVNNIEFWSIVLEATEKTQIPFLKRAFKREVVYDNVHNEINSLIHEIIKKGDQELGIKALTNFLWELKPIIINEQRLIELITWCENNLGTLNGGNFFIRVDGANLYDTDIAFTNITPFLNELHFSLANEFNKIRYKIIYTYHNEIVRGHSNKEHLSPLIKRLDSRLKDVNKVIEIKEDNTIITENISIISLKDVNIQMRKILPLLICKQLYEDKKKDDNKTKYLNIIIDEAHNILSSVSERESETWKDYRLETFEEIIKEGRKFGVFLTIASQRPSDISPTIISQLHNFFLHRLINNNDIKAVEKTVSYLDKLSFESLPILPTGTCILAGLSAQVPVMIDIGKIDKKQYEPNNKTMILINNWIDNND